MASTQSASGKGELRALNRSDALELSDEIALMRVATARLLELAPAIRGGDTSAFEEFMGIANELLASDG